MSRLKEIMAYKHIFPNWATHVAWMNNRENIFWLCKKGQYQPVVRGELRDNLYKVPGGGFPSGPSLNVVEIKKPSLENK